MPPKGEKFCLFYLITIFYLSLLIMLSLLIFLFFFFWGIKVVTRAKTKDFPQHNLNPPPLT